MNDPLHVPDLYTQARLDRLITVDDIYPWKTPGKLVHCFFGIIHRFIMGYRVLDFEYVAMSLSVSGRLIIQSKVINIRSNTFGNPIFQKGLQN